MTPEDLDRRLETVDAKLDALALDLQELRTLMNTETDRCAYRVEIAQSAALPPRITDLEKRMRDIELNTAKIAVIVGIVEGLILGALQYLPGLIK